MTPYIFIFAINLFIAYFIDKMYDKNTLFCRTSIAFLILINTIFCGLRDFGVGYDTNMYIDSYYYQAANTLSINDFFDNDFDKGFLAISYLASLFSRNNQSLLIATALFINFFSMLAFAKYRKTCGISFFMSTLIFCVLYYCHTLNLMRQYCAISLLAYGFAFFTEKKYITYFTFQFLAFFFHSTSILFIIVPIIWLLSDIQSVIKRNVISVAILFLAIIMITSYFYFLIFFGNMGIVSEIYTDRYGESGGYVNNKVSSGSGLGTLFSIVAPLLFIYYGFKRKSINNKELYCLIMLSIFASLFELLGKYIDYVSRLSMYFSFIYNIFFVKLLTSKKNNLILRIVVIFLYVLISYKIFIIEEGGSVYPYKSKILDIK